MQAGSEEECEQVLLAKEHEALEHAVEAVTRHRSLLGLFYCLWLLQELQGRPGREQRDRHRALLHQALPLEELDSLTPGDFAPPEWDIVPADRCSRLMPLRAAAAAAIAHVVCWLLPMHVCMD